MSGNSCSIEILLFAIKIFVPKVVLAGILHRRRDKSRCQFTGTLNAEELDKIGYKFFKVTIVFDGCEHVDGVFCYVGNFVPVLRQVALDKQLQHLIIY